MASEHVGQTSLHEPQCHPRTQPQQPAKMVAIIFWKQPVQSWVEKTCRCTGRPKCGSQKQWGCSCWGREVRWRMAVLALLPSCGVLTSRDVHFPLVSEKRELWELINWGYCLHQCSVTIGEWTRSCWLRCRMGSQLKLQSQLHCFW